MSVLRWPGGHSGGIPPDPIPNSAVKAPSAHGTACQHAGESVAARPAKNGSSIPPSHRNQSPAREIARGFFVSSPWPAPVLELDPGDDQATELPRAWRMTGVSARAKIGSYARNRASRTGGRSWRTRNRETTRKRRSPNRTRTRRRLSNPARRYSPLSHPRERPRRRLR